MTSPLPWTLEVEGLGKIQSASIEPRPLLLLIGKNNSGKRSLASLLWGLLATDELWMMPSQGEAQRRCVEWAKRLIKRWRLTSDDYILTEADWGLFSAWLDELLEANKARFAQILFNSSEVPIQRLRLRLNPRAYRIHAEILHWVGADAVYWSVSEEAEPIIRLIYDSYVFPKTEGREVLKALLQALLFAPWGRVDESCVPFLPASRTGFMLTYKAVVRQQERKWERHREPEPSLELSLPMESFVERLARDSSRIPGLFAAEAAFLEREALEGRLGVSRSIRTNEFSFLPTDVAASHARVKDSLPSGLPPEQVGQPLPELPIHLSSSLVTELAPLVFLLRYASDLKVLVLEEPESHLHPHHQRVVAQVIARLIRKGVSVWITTHSENFCQQINNFISLGTHPARAALQQELGYTSEDYLLPEEVGAYQFQPVGPRSELRLLRTTDEGIAMPSFNEELLKLAQESQRLSEAREES
ncbi:MAG: AAA family ATPase [Myxococcota bacterium]